MEGENGEIPRPKMNSKRRFTFIDDTDLLIKTNKSLVRRTGGKQSVDLKGKKRTD